VWPTRRNGASRLKTPPPFCFAVGLGPGLNVPTSFFARRTSSGVQRQSVLPRKGIAIEGQISAFESHFCSVIRWTPISFADCSVECVFITLHNVAHLC
jgi:hypothetical protein